MNEPRTAASENPFGFTDFLSFPTELMTSYSRDLRGLEIDLYIRSSFLESVVYENGNDVSRMAI